MISYFFNIVILAVFHLSVHIALMAGHKDTLVEDVVKHFDVIVIGSGSGKKLVRRVADLGFKVTVLEQEKLGGACLNRGCIPSKMLLHIADLASSTP